MPIELKVPEVGESISEVEIGEWLKKEGDFVERDDEVVVIETDKATVEISAPESGTITKILKSSGQTAAVHEVIAYLEAGEPHRGTTTPTVQKSEAASAQQASAVTRPSSQPSAAWDDDRKMIRPTGTAVRPMSEPPADGSSQESEARTEPEQVAETVAKAGTETVPEAEALPQFESRT